MHAQSYNRGKISGIDEMEESLGSEILMNTKQ